MTIRIPIDVKQQVEEIVERFRSNNLASTQTDDSERNRISQLTTIIERYKAAAKSSRDWTKCNQLIQEIEAEIERYE
jgi:hypothetical protein